jgi:hypothetical protein
MRKSAAAVARRAPAGSHLVVRTIEELQALTRTGHSRTAPSIALDLPGLEPSAARAVAARIEAYRRACGCSSGAAFMSLGFGGLLLAFVWRDGLAVALLWHFPLAVAGGIVCAGVGKAIGLLYAHARLRSEVADLIRGLHASNNGV